VYKNVLRNPLARAYASSVMSGTGYVAANAIDGTGDAKLNNSRWVSNDSTAGTWLQVDLGCLAKIDKFILYSGNSGNGTSVDNAIQNGDFQINKDGQWVTVSSFRGNWVGNYKVEKAITAVVTDKVRIYFPITEPQYRVFEFEAYGEILGKQAELYKKNLLTSDRATKGYYISDTSGQLATSSAGVDTTDYLPVQEQKTYKFEGFKTGYTLTMRAAWFNATKGYIGGTTITADKQVSAPWGARYIRFSVHPNDYPMASFYEAGFNGNKTAFLSPEENLIPPFTSPSWIENNPAGGTLAIDSNNPYRATFSGLTSQGRTVYIPVTKGKTYSFSFIGVQYPTVYRIYKGKYNYHVDSQVIGIDNNNISFTVDDSYNGFISVRLAVGIDNGSGAVNGLMLVEGQPKAFKPYKLTPKKANLVPRDNLLPPLTQWKKTNYPAVVISDYEGEIDPTSNYTGFKIENFDIKRNTDYTLSVEEITPGAVLFVAYQDSTGTNRYATANSDSLVKTVNIPASAKLCWVEMHYQQNRGKARFKNFKLEEGNLKTPFKPQVLGAKSANLKVKKNMLPPLTDLRWYLATGQIKGEIRGDYEYYMTLDSDRVVGLDIDMPLEANQTYTLSADAIGENARIRVVRKSDNVFLANLNNTNSPVIFTPNTSDTFVRIENNNKAGSYTIKNFMLQKGSVSNPVFEPYKLTNKPSIWS